MKSLFDRPLAALVAAGLVWGSAGGGFAQSPGMPAAPLAGGGAATAGGSFMNVHGDSIVMPASYCEPAMGYGGAYGAMCPDDGSGYGNCAGADFGGASYPDQCGPHYFDIYAGAIVLDREDAFEDVPPLGTITSGGDFILDPQELSEDEEYGFELAARLDLGPLSVLEAKYFGLLSMGFDETVRSVDVAPMGADFSLQSVFNEYGQLAGGIDGLSEGSVYTLDLESDLQSTELSYRRYWVGYNPRVSGTYLAGFRYLRMTEALNFDAVAAGGTSNLNWEADNDLVGAQIGGDGWICLRQGLRLGMEGKAGIYNNRWEYQHVTSIPDADFTNANVFANDNQVAFAGETSVDLVADILPSFSIRGGYRVLYMSSLVTVGNNINPADPTSALVFTQDDALYHGFHGGVEYIW
ncbi:MAG TPA: BBP7 family outer membrane beta-barrel protein [Lacipirellula sp.]